MKDFISHEGHRARLKTRFRNEGLENFEPHNILELVLFYSIPRKDTNELAHALINRFGSLRGVFDANYEDLLQVNGVSDNTATLIKMIPQLAKEYQLDHIDPETTYEKSSQLGRLFVNLFLGETKERTYLLLLNNRFERLGLICLHEGNVNSTMISTRKILDEVVKYNASMIVLAHNHPNGMTCPSNEDIETTISLQKNLALCEVELLEHYVIAGNHYYTIMHNTNSIRQSPKDQKIKQSSSIEYDE